MQLTTSNRSTPWSNPLRRLLPAGGSLERGWHGTAMRAGPLLWPAVLATLTPSALAHTTGEAALHWHASDILGVALVTALAVGALWLARRHRRGDGE